jgi:peptidoglycan hydrolase-like protein with peptidoglycan-binding domain
VADARRSDRKTEPTTTSRPSPTPRVEPAEETPKTEKTPTRPEPKTLPRLDVKVNVTGVDRMFQDGLPYQVVGFIQHILGEHGNYAGPIDGYVNPELRESIRTFQRERDVPDSGVPDQKTLELLGFKVT